MSEMYERTNEWMNEAQRQRNEIERGPEIDREKKNDEKYLQMIVLNILSGSLS